MPVTMSNSPKVTNENQRRGESYLRFSGEADTDPIQVEMVSNLKIYGDKNEFIDKPQPSAYLLSDQPDPGSILQPVRIKNRE